MKAKKENAYNTNVFRLLRLCNDLSVIEVADAMSLSPQYIRDIEKGYRYPAQDKLEKFCNLYNISIETFEEINKCQEKYKNEHPLKGYQKMLMRTLTDLL